MGAILDVLSVGLQIIGCLFFFAGTVGVLRFPDAHSRLHALTKADNLGLGFIVLGVVPNAGSLTAVGILFVIWFLSIAASTTTCQMIAQAALLEQSERKARA